MRRRRDIGLSQILMMLKILIGLNMEILAKEEIGENLQFFKVSKGSDCTQQELGQYMTPKPVASFMCSLFELMSDQYIKVLDAGAGMGALTTAFLNLTLTENVRGVEAHAWEIDPKMQEELQKNLRYYDDLDNTVNLSTVIHRSDFIEDAVALLQRNEPILFSHAILNPPYKKIKSESEHRLLLREVGIETVNYYSAFVALTILLMEPQGQIVAIIPRSFCNGLYYKPFRKFLLGKCSIKQIHLFDSRKDLFKADNVLQENIILRLEKNGIQDNVLISTSFDANFCNYECTSHSFEKIVKNDDPESFIHIPTEISSESPLFKCSLKELPLEVCTGPVVDFRLKEFWSQEPGNNTIPLIYPHHFSNGKFTYPKAHKKPNALIFDEQIKKWLMPAGYYVLVKRFSSKEERKRIVANVIDPNELPSPFFGFENHWDVFHFKKNGIDENLAYGLALFLNSTIFELHFRTFSGHTQVNATDLRSMKYPPLDVLTKLGSKYKRIGLSQEQIDIYISEIEDQIR